MDQEINETELNSSKTADVEDRRDAIRKLGQYAAYAAPLTVLAAKAKATQGGTGSGGRRR